MLLVYIHIVILIHFFFFAFVWLLLLFFFFFFKQAVQSTFRMEEIYHSVAQQLDDERKRRVSTVQTLRSEEHTSELQSL